MANTEQAGTAHRSNLDGVPVEAEFFDAAGEEYRVPAYYCRAGQSVTDVARILGGRVPGRSERPTAIGARLPFAAIKENGLYYPVVMAEGD